MDLASGSEEVYQKSEKREVQQRFSGSQRRQRSCQGQTMLRGGPDEV